MSIVYKDPTSNPKKSIYPKDVDISRVPRTEEGDILEMILSFYAALGNRTLTSILDRFRNELEDAIKRCFKKKCFDKSTQLEPVGILKGKSLVSPNLQFAPMSD